MTEMLFPLALYAETHFRFFGLTPSALFRREPEIVFDLPRRLARGCGGLPVMLLVNDIHQYPIRIESVQIAVSRHAEGAMPELIEFDEGQIAESEADHPLKSQMGAYVLTIPREKSGAGGGAEIFVNACLRYRRINKKGVLGRNVQTVLNDNLVTSTKYSYRCVIADDDYPGADLCTFGDTHCHSQFSRSHVEFGPPVGLTGRAAEASGLGFAAVTDHSYDLACDPYNFLRQDKDLRLWEMYKSSINNYGGATVLIPAEEVSVLNSKGKVVHMCGLGINEYIPGTLDGARKNIHVKKQLTISGAADEIARQGGVSFAAHPGSKAGLMQRIFLRRGTWSDADTCEKLGGVQAVNSGFFDSWMRGRRLWVNMLQRGLKVPLLAGSDAHGDFNRYRAISIPFLQIHEDAERYMSFARTGVYGKRVDVKGIIGGIKDAETFITNGPFLSICDARNPDASLIGNKKTVGTDEAKNLCVRAIATKEFGPLGVIKVIMGRPGFSDETIIIREAVPDDTRDAVIPIPAEAIPETCYLRAEAHGKSPQGLPTTAATSACFVGY
ncbi:MAG: hypothetical protein FWB94_02980 [Chitinispirillia bacterium]|nr:hypothetical protein [Chitinispirillia bacterium]